MSYNKFTQSAENKARVVESHRASHLEKSAREMSVKLASSRLKPLDWSAQLGVRREDIVVFVTAARVFDHIIILRSTNPKSLPYIDQKKKFTPKPIDCKPKTADRQAYVPAVDLQVDCAGLVVDPTVVGNAAFNGKKFEKASDSWASFLKDKSGEEQVKKVYRRRNTKGFFAVDMDRQSRRYGCLMLSEQDLPSNDFNLETPTGQEFKRIHMRYIHGDYDLYGLIDIAKVESVVRSSGSRGTVSPNVTKGELHGTPHIYSERFAEIQAFLNLGIGAEMIQHDSLDNVTHQDDELYLFYPFGGKYRLDDTAENIKDVYRRLFHQEVRG